MRAVEAARDLYDRAKKASADSRPAVTAKLLHQALRVLGPQVQDDVNWLEISTKVLISLASAEAETKSPASGLKHLDTAESMRLRMPDCKERSTLRFTVGLQRAIILARIGRLGDSVALFDALLPSVDAEVEDDKLLAHHGPAQPLVRPCADEQPGIRARICVAASNWPKNTATTGSPGRPSTAWVTSRSSKATSPRR